MAAAADDPAGAADRDARQPARHRVGAALLGLALGDAIGAPFEGQRAIATDEVAAWLADDRPLIWTDDTHMAITLGRVLVAHGADHLDPQVLGDAFATAYADEPWRGYGAGPPQVFAMARGGSSYVEAAGSLFGGSGSFGNGAAMRVAPAALAAGGDVEHAVALARSQSLVTHTHPDALDGAALIAATSVLLAGSGPQAPAAAAVAAAAGQLAPGPVRAATEQLLDTCHDRDRLLATAARIGTGVVARESVPAAVAALLAAPDDLVASLTTAVQLGGDTDTIAAMAGTMAAARLGPEGLPDRLLERLEARDELAALSHDLLREARPEAAATGRPPG